MLSFRQYRGLANNDAAPEAASSIIEAQAGLDAQIDKLVDDWINELKNELVQGTFATGQRSMWDRFKNTLANIWHGRQSIDNPYLWQNKLGDDLGRKVESVTNIHIPLGHYKYLQESFSPFVNQLNEAAMLPPGTANLRIMQILDNQATILKRRLKNLFAAVPEPAPASKPAPSAPSPASPAQPPAAPTADTNPPAPAKDEYHFENLPPADNRDWDSLTQAEKDRWNKLGGGISPRQGSRGRVGVEMPYILRLGDPRRRNLAAAEAGIQNHYKARRVEKAENPIKSKQELEQRVKRVVEKNRSKPQPTAQSGPATGSGGSGAPRQRPQPVQATPPEETETPTARPTVPSPAENRPQASNANDDEPAIETIPAQDSHSKFKKIVEWLADSHFDDNQAEALKALLGEWPNSADELRSKIREFSKQIISSVIPSEEKSEIEEKLDKADTDEKLHDFVDKLLHHEF